MTTLATILMIAAVASSVLASSPQLPGPRQRGDTPPLRGISVAFSALLLVFAAQMYLSPARSTRITVIFSASRIPTRTPIPGLLLVSIALAIVQSSLLERRRHPSLYGLARPSRPRRRLLVGPRVVCHELVVKPNKPCAKVPIAHDIEMTRRA
jgi:hypothetical protein